ncbi:hypothetical protein BCR32DRAFT_288596 [Anaeromyces robustus]|uniref:Uncharacterized protein n=1 Tax=Anaeromyces robustus TaxID=1754192 RepID=A0A1Y1UFZ4_9FUNG|nr:hypothetical protein BCR32DRAFT_288596 [Anaeromyces robustus]|eukprot:ORX36973.1 hypothetical protein BCR32DRAFT_288596 [Anaeromyces robustus]
MIEKLELFKNQYEKNSVVLPWPDQYPSVINKDFTREIRSHSISWIAQQFLFIAIQLEEDEEESKRNLIQELLNTNGYDFLKEVKALQIIICKPYMVITLFSN